MNKPLHRILAFLRTDSDIEQEFRHSLRDSGFCRNSAWVGRGAASLGLAGPIERDTLEAVLQVGAPDAPYPTLDGRRGGVPQDPAVDLTLSAPTSASLLALVGGDERIVATHDRAVRSALEWAEGNAVTVSVGDRMPGAGIRVDGPGLVAATFRHITSRKLRPHLHTRCVVANIGRDRNGSWRSMREGSLTRSKAAIREVYCDELARGLRRLGYALERAQTPKSFEISGVSGNLVKAFSALQGESQAALEFGSNNRGQATQGNTALSWLVRAEELAFDLARLVVEAEARAALAQTVRRAVGVLGRGLLEVPSGRLAIAVATLWLVLPAPEREATAVVVPNPALRRRVNEAIRRSLVREGVILGLAWKGRQLVGRDVGRTELADPASYAPGDTVVFLRSCEELGIEGGDKLLVGDVDLKRSTLCLVDALGRTKCLEAGSLAAIADGVEVFREPLQLRTGDVVRRTGNGPVASLAPDTIAQIEAVGDGHVRFRLDNGTTAELADSDPRLGHLERAWATPPMDSRARLADNVIAAVDTTNPRCATQQNLYAAIAAVPGWARLLTDNATRLADLLESATGERFGGIEAVAGDRPRC